MNNSHYDEMHAPREGRSSGNHRNQTLILTATRQKNLH